MPRDEDFEVRRNGSCLRGDRRARVSHAISLRCLVVGERALRTKSGIGRLEPVRVGSRCVGGESLRPLLHIVVARFQASLVGAKVVCTIRCNGRVERGLVGGPPVTLLAITLQLLDRLSSVGKDEELCQAGCLAIEALSQAGGGLHLLEGPGATVPFIVDVVSIVIGDALPVDTFAVRGDGYAGVPITWNDPSAMPAAAISAARTTLRRPTASVMTVTMT